MFSTEINPGWLLFGQRVLINFSTISRKCSSLKQITVDYFYTGPCRTDYVVGLSEKHFLKIVEVLTLEEFPS